MFRHEGPSRSYRQNAAVAGYLACVGGFVNAAGFVLLAAFTSHVTGNLGHLSADLALGEPLSAAALAGTVLAFWVGAFAASLVVESGAHGSHPRSYGAALLVEAALLLVFAWSRAGHAPAWLAHREVGAMGLALAMGMQNSLVTRLSGAVVRTTHMTGVVTDLGIEGARWLRWSARGARPIDPPAREKATLLLVILGAFVAGSVGGASAASALGSVAMAIPAAAVAACAAFAFRSARQPAPG